MMLAPGFKTSVMVMTLVILCVPSVQKSSLYENKKVLRIGEEKNDGWVQRKLAVVFQPSILL